jgi:hypothetical protein
MRRLGGAVTILALAFSGCGSQRPVSVKNGMIVVGKDIAESSLPYGVLGIHVGSSASDVKATLGIPFTRSSDTFRGQRETCWAYQARQVTRRSTPSAFASTRPGEFVGY